MVANVEVDSTGSIRGGEHENARADVDIHLIGGLINVIDRESKQWRNARTRDTKGNQIELDDKIISRKRYQ